MNLPPRIWEAEESVRRDAARKWVASRLAAERPRPAAPDAAAEQTEQGAPQAA